ncbi:MAG: universal stress protein [Candidatus Thiodiazotropha sp. 6PDIVS]
MNALVAIDLSPTSWTVIEQALSLLDQSSTRHLWLLHIANPEPDFVGFEPGPQAVRDGQAKDFHQQHKSLQDFADRVRTQGSDCTALQVQGAYAEKILVEAEKLEADVIVVGSHGKGLTKELIYGSTSNQLVRRSEIPVLIVPTSD